VAISSIAMLSTRTKIDSSIIDLFKQRAQEIH